MTYSYFVTGRRNGKREQIRMLMLMQKAACGEIVFVPALGSARGNGKPILSLMHKKEIVMRKILDKTEKGEIWVEFTTGLTTYHIRSADGEHHHVTTDAAEAKRIWTKLQAKK